MIRPSEELRRLLLSIDRKSYPAYKDTKGEYRFQDYVLSIDHVQGDPFASPSKISIRVKGDQGGFPDTSFGSREKRISLQDYLLRLLGARVEQYSFKARGSGKSGLIQVSRCGQEILERTACAIDERTRDMTLRLDVGFPANGRTINSGELIKILFDFLPSCIAETCFYGRYKAVNKKEVETAAKLAEDQTEIRRLLGEMGLVAFVANGAALPRESGVSPRPMRGAVKFRSPSSMEVEISLPNAGVIKGMGIPKGITLIVGGGYHGKSTLLEALELGVYNHISGDGREFVITDNTAVKLRAEDGRSIRGVDISLFIGDLPNGRDTGDFTTEDASGSTSQAANVMESVEAGAKVFLVDEDTSATNFMIRDELMQRVVHRDQEPITPFIERVGLLHRELDLSTIIVAGSSGSYFHVADHVIQMNRYLPEEITKEAKREAKNFPHLENPSRPGKIPACHRAMGKSPAFRNCDRMKIKMVGRDSVMIDREVIDLRYVEQLVDVEQYEALAYLLKYAETNLADGRRTMREIVDQLWGELEKKGLDGLLFDGNLRVNMALPRKQEIFACFNRYRKLEIVRPSVKVRSV